MSGSNYVISQIQHAANINSIFGFTSGEYFTEKELRRRYKKLALLVHPDKCKSDGAEGAFKILNNALETLILRLPEAYQGVENSTAKNTQNQREDSNATTENAKSASESGRRQNFSKCDEEERHEKERNCNKSSSPETSNKCPSDPKMAEKPEDGSRTKTSRSEFAYGWAQAEEEYSAEDLQRRISREVRMKAKLMKRQVEEMERAEHLQAECEELQKDVDSRASSWKVWQSNKKNVKMSGTRYRGAFESKDN
jgi:curved DNA-binding protein CbpA